MLRTILFAGALVAAAAAAEPPGAPKPEGHVSPVYPRAAMAREAEGEARIYVTLDGEGRVAAARIAAETPPDLGFGEAALAAVRQWTFPKNIPGDYRVTVRFRLQDPPAAAPGGTTTGPRGELPAAPEPVYKGGLRYPASALARNLSGTVYLIVAIDDSGAVTSVEIESERPKKREFGVNARKAVRNWRYPPGHAGVYRTIVHFGIYDDADFPAGEAPRGTTPLAAAPEPATRVEPDYPRKARAAGVAGEVALSIYVNERGSVDDAHVMRETPTGHDFGWAAIAAARQWTFPKGTTPGDYYLVFSFNP